MPIPMADATATAALILAATAFTLVVATIAFVVSRTRDNEVSFDASSELTLLREQLAAQQRPLLVDVLLAAPVPPDMGADDGVEAEIVLPGVGARRFDPRRVFVSTEAGKVYLSVPLRNVGRGLAVIDGAGVTLEGPGVDELEHRAVRRDHVPVNETTRIDLIAGYRMHEPAQPRDIAWQLKVPYTDFAGEQRTVAAVAIVSRGEDADGQSYVECVEQESVGRDGVGYERFAAGPSPPVARTADEESPDSAPIGSELPAVEPSPQPTAPRETVTDIWGNPIGERRRRRR